MIGFSRFVLLVLGLLAVSVPAYAASACDPWDVSVATTPVPPQSAASLQRAEMRAASSAAGADVVMVGDSLIGNWPQAQLDASFPGRKVWNFGVGQDRTQNTLWRMQDPRLALAHPSKVVLLVGTNNLGDNQSACAIAAGIAAIAARAEAIWPGVGIYYIPIPPRGGDFKVRDQLRQDVNRAVASTIASLKLDDNGLSCGGYAGPALDDNALRCAPGQWTRCANYKDDNLHLTDAGYSILSALLAGVAG